MSAIDDVFSSLRKDNRKAFVPFVTAGDPNLQVTGEALQVLDQSGASICEVGIPYSDPIADGPVIQASYTRALDAGTKLPDIFTELGRVSGSLDAPLVTMVSYAIIFRYGLERYVTDARQAGFAGAIVPDLLVDEASELAAICRAEDFSLIQLVTPTTPRERQVRIAESSSGFIYYVSVTGITGERTQLPTDLGDNVSWLREQTDLPICIGFGISQPEHAELLAPVADGLIVGSAIVRRIAAIADGSRAEVLADLGEYAKSLVRAMHPAG